MAWVRLDPERAMNRKLRKAGFAARGLDEAAICLSLQDRTDGHISRDQLDMLAIAHSEKKISKLVDLLVEVGRWTPNGDGWHIHDWQQFNWTKDRQAEETQKKAEAGRRGGLAKAKARATADAKHMPQQPLQQPLSQVPSTRLANSTQLNSSPSSPPQPEPETATSPPDQDQDQQPQNPTHSPAVQKLIDRWLTVIEKPSPLAQADADRWIPHLATILATETIDQLIGQAAQQTPSPRRITYLVASCRDFASQHLPGTTITDPHLSEPDR